MSEPRESILSGGIADQLLAKAKPLGPARVEMAGISWELRICLENLPRRGRGLTRKVRASGGLVLEARSLRTFEHRSGARRERLRICKGYTRGTVSRAAHRIHRGIKLAEVIDDQREAVFRVWEPIRARGVDVEPYEESGTAAGHTSVYSDMTPTDCDYWLEIAKAVPA